jgi:hypothetical protein
MKTRQDARKRRWQDEEVDVLASGCTTREFTGTVTMVDSVHEGFCVVNSNVYVPVFTNIKAGEGDDWDGCGSTPKLRIGDRLKVSAALRPHGRNKWNAYKSERVSFAASGKVRRRREKCIEKQVRKPKYVRDHVEVRRREEDVWADLDLVLSGDNSNSIRDNVTTGLIAMDRCKKQKHRRDEKETSGFLAIHHGVCLSDKTSFLGVLSGNAHVTEKGVAIGLSEFCSVAITNCKPLTSGKWYYEAEILTGGVVQLGWADSLFRGDDVEGDGVGDDPHSWAFDGCRHVKWSCGKKKEYGEAVGWKQGDIVGCMLNVDLGQISFTANGRDVGIAFQNIPNSDDGLFAALSLEDNEAVEITISRRNLRFSPPLGYEPLETASLVPTLAHHDNEHITNKTCHVDGPAETTQIQEPGGLANCGEALTSQSPQLFVSAAASASPMVSYIANSAHIVPIALDLSTFETASALEKLGLDRLKSALLAIGAKCGGTLKDRASRLFSTKGRDRIGWDPKILAKPGKK